MLTIATITPKQGESYYQKENYYSKGAALENSEWLGEGAARLGLSGSIADSEVYKNLVNGITPDGKTPLRGKPKKAGFEATTGSGQSKQTKKKKQPQERAGVDLTFSAPKSVSIACLVGGDKRLEEAHRTAVKRVLRLIEERYAQTRVKGNRIQTDNLTIALWHHDTSRELDPHLHSHCILMNFTQLPNGAWQSRTDENLYYNKMLLGQMYRQELAIQCRKLGYEIELHSKDLFEIRGYTREHLEVFSKRHEQILDKLAEIGEETTTENKIWAWRKTRIKKNHEIERSQMLPIWKEEAGLHGIIHPVPQPEAQLPPVNEVQANLRSAVDASIEHCSERKSAFKVEDLEAFITSELQPFTLDEIQQAIQDHPELFKTFDRRYTTKLAVAREIATIRLMEQGKGQFASISHPEVIENYLEGKGLTQGQRAAVLLAATSSDQFMAWQGVAGAGKTYALRHLKQVIEALKGLANEHTIRGFAPSAAAAKVLEEELEIQSGTVAMLIHSQPPTQIQPNQIWIVDEAGLLSAADCYDLMQRAEMEHARVIFVGDTRQLSAIEAGNPFKSLQQAGIVVARLDESLRQKAPALQKAVSLAADGKIAASLAYLERLGKIVEIQDAQARVSRIAHSYMQLSLDERLQTLILAGTNEERQAITHEIREALKKEGRLGYAIKAIGLKAKDITSVQARYTHHYQVGDVVIPIRSYRRSELQKFKPYTVKEIEGDKLLLEDLAGNQQWADPMKFRKTVYSQISIEVAVGDRLKWTRNDRELGRRNGQEFTVMGIEGQIASIVYPDGRAEQISLMQPLHLDHALVSTVFSSQGKTADRVLLSSTKDQTVSRESFYVAISRAKHDLQIVAESFEFLREQSLESKAQENPLTLLPIGQSMDSYLTTQEKIYAKPEKQPSDNHFSRAKGTGETNTRDRSRDGQPLPFINRGGTGQRSRSGHRDTEAGTSTSNFNPRSVQQSVATTSSTPEQPTSPTSDLKKDQSHERIKSPRHIDARGIGERVNQCLNTSGSALRSIGGQPQQSLPESGESASQISAAAREISEGINHAAELQEINQVAGAIERLKRQLASRQSEAGGTASLRAAVEQFYEAARTDLAQQAGRELLDAVASYLDQSTLETASTLFGPLTEFSEQCTQFPPYNPLIQTLTDQITTHTHSLEETSNEPRSDPGEPGTINSTGRGEVVRRRSKSTPSETRADRRKAGEGRGKSYQFATGPRELSRAIRERVEQEAFEQLADSVEAVSRSLKDYQLKPSRATDLRNAVEQIDSILAANLQQRPARERARKLARAIFNHVNEESIHSELADLIVELKNGLGQIPSPEHMTALRHIESVITQHKSMSGIPGLDRSFVDGKWVRTEKLTTKQFDQLLQSLKEERNEQLNPQQPQPTNGSTIGGRASERLEAGHSTIGPDRIVGTERPEFTGAKHTVNSAGAGTNLSRTATESNTQQPTAELQQLHQSSHSFIERINAMHGDYRSMATESNSKQQRYRSTDHHIGESINTLAGRSPASGGGTKPAPAQARPGVRDNVERLGSASRQVKRTLDGLGTLADRVRNLPLEEVAQRLGLEPDKYDRCKWKNDAHIISINDSKFYDHLHDHGGGGAIDLVMHIQDLAFRDAVVWLAGSSAYVSQPQSRRPSKAKIRKPFKLPIPDQAKWPKARQYLIGQRGLPGRLIDELYSAGKLYASGLTEEALDKLRSKGRNGEGLVNVVFVRKNFEGKTTGATLRGVQGKFKGLAEGSQRDQGWFWVKQGSKQAQRVVLTEAPIDSISLMLLEQAAGEKRTTAYLSTDGAGGIPYPELQNLIKRGGEVVIAFDADQDAERLSAKVREQIPEATRLRPVHGKDWNEQWLHELPAALWDRYAKQAPARPVERTISVIRMALQDGYLPELVGLVLDQDPMIAKIKHEQGEQKAQDYIQQSIRAEVSRSQKGSTRKQPTHGALEQHNTEIQL